MKKMLIKSTGEPILEITQDISAGKPTPFGTFRDRFPDAGWSQMQRCNLDISDTKKVEANEKLLTTFVEDLAYMCGGNTNKFSKIMKEKGLIVITQEDYDFLVTQKIIHKEKIGKENFINNLGKLRQALLNMYGEKGLEEFDDIIEESGTVHSMEFVKEPVGQFQEEEGNEFILGIWIDQKCGISGDDYSGTFCVKVKENKFVKFEFYM